MIFVFIFLPEIIGMLYCSSLVYVQDKASEKIAIYAVSQSFKPGGYLFLFLFVNVLVDSEENERTKELGREMLRRCAGLPLPIIVLSGLVSTKHTVHEWKALTKNV